MLEKSSSVYDSKKLYSGFKFGSHSKEIIEVSELIITVRPWPVEVSIYCFALRVKCVFNRIV